MYRHRSLLVTCALVCVVAECAQRAMCYSRRLWWSIGGARKSIHHDNEPGNRATVSLRARLCVHIYIYRVTRTPTRISPASASCLFLFRERASAPARIFSRLFAPDVLSGPLNSLVRSLALPLYLSLSLSLVLPRRGYGFVYVYDRPGFSAWPLFCTFVSCLEWYFRDTSSGLRARA